MKDLVIGSITGYKFPQIKTWVNSLDRSGFDGYKLMICYNIDTDTIDELVKRDYGIFNIVTHTPFSIVVRRFYDMWRVLTSAEQKFRYVIATDVKDVIFQRNPTIWLEETLLNYPSSKVIVGSESIKYSDEAWGKNNLQKSFGMDVYESIKDKVIVNAGTFAGEYSYIKDLYMQIYLLCHGLPGYIEGGGGPDQAALNVLTAMQPWSTVTHMAKSEDAWAAQLGTMGPGKRQTGVLEDSPKMEQGTVVTSKGVPFTLVHQYDRIPDWKQIIEKKYE